MPLTMAWWDVFWRIWVSLPSKSYACVEKAPLHTVYLQIIAKCSGLRGSPWLFFHLVHSCISISAPHSVTALLSFNQNSSFLHDTLLPPLVQSVEFSSHSTITCSVCSVCVNVCVFHRHVSIPHSFVNYIGGPGHLSNQPPAEPTRTLANGINKNSLVIAWLEYTRTPGLLSPVK